MSRMKWLAAAGVALVVVPTVVYLVRPRSDSARFTGLAGAQQKQIEDWESAERYGFTPEHLKALSGHLLQTVPTTPPPTGTMPVSVAELSPQQAADLAVAIEGLLEAISSNRPGVHLEYANQRSEVVPPAMLVAARASTARARKLTQADADRLSVQDILQHAFDAERYDSKWESFYQKPSKMSLWRGTATGPNSPPLSEADSRLFRNQTSNNRLFVAATGVSATGDYSGQRDPTLGADIYIVVRHNITMYNQPVPCCIRFYFNRYDQKWHAIRLSSVNTLSDHGAKLFF